MEEEQPDIKLTPVKTSDPQRKMYRESLKRCLSPIQHFNLKENLLKNNGNITKQRIKVNSPFYNIEKRIYAILKIMKIYLDVCCINRPFDDQNQDRIHLEAEAVISVLKHIDEGKWELVSSDAVVYEINQTLNEEKRERLLSINNKAQTYITLDEAIVRRASEIQKIGFTDYDAMHIACSEKAQVDVFLSTDDKLVKKAQTSTNKLSIAIQNPLTWIQKEFEK